MERIEGVAWGGTNVLNQFLSRYFRRDRDEEPVLSNQNGRAPVPVSDEELLRARDKRIRQARSGPQGPDYANAILAAWPLEKLTAEHAEAWCNGRVLIVGAYTGFSGWRVPESREIDLAPDADDASLGGAVNEALAYSRELSLYEWRGGNDVDVKEKMGQYRAWRDRLMSRYGYKTQRALFLNMLHVTLDRRAGRLRCSPSNHERIDAWGGDGIPPNSDVVVQADSPAAEIGAALRLTFSRCLDSYGQKAKRS